MNSPDVGSIFLIEERKQREKFYIQEERLPDGDQSNISIYRIVFYADFFFYNG